MLSSIDNFLRLCILAPWWATKILVYLQVCLTWHIASTEIWAFSYNLHYLNQSIVRIFICFVDRSVFLFTTIWCFFETHLRFFIAFLNQHEGSLWKRDLLLDARECQVDEPPCRYMRNRPQLILSIRCHALSTSFLLLVWFFNRFSSKKPSVLIFFRTLNI